MAAEQTIHDDFDRLWRTNFLAKLSIEISDYTFSNGVVGKIVVYNMEERPRMKIVGFVGSKPIATSKLDARLKKEHVELRLDTFLDEATIRKVETIVRAMMVEKGFQNALVTSEIQPLGSPTLVRRRFHSRHGFLVSILIRPMRHSSAGFFGTTSEVCSSLASQC